VTEPPPPNEDTRIASAERLERLEELVGSVAHDLNNMLSVITTLSELLVRYGAEDHPDREDLEEIHRAAVRGSQLTAQLLAHVRPAPQEGDPV
jgi:signal transduction histidine kinase